MSTLAPDIETLLNVNVLCQSVPDRDKAKELLIRFKLSLQRELMAFDHAERNQDWDRVGRHAHRIRSGSSYLGVKHIGVSATAVEALIKAHAPQDDVVAASSALRRVCLNYIQQTDAVIENHVDERWYSGRLGRQTRSTSF